MLKKTHALLAILFLALVVLMPLAQAEEQQQISPPHVEKGENFNHNVMLELFSTTGCQYCPSAEEVARELNAEYGEHFSFVTMLTDVNDDAAARSDDYQVLGVPDAVFDGGYRREVGEQDGTDTYEGHIEDSGTRQDPPPPSVELAVEAVDNGDWTMAVTYTATYTETLALPFFDAHIRVYIAEKVSRYLDIDENPIPYAFLDYAFDEDIRLLSQVETTDTMTWDFSDDENATFDNLVVIAAIFDKSSGVEQYVVQTATTETTNIVIDNVVWTPEYPRNTDDMSFWADVTGDFEEVELEYAICTDGMCGAPEYVTMESGEGPTFTTTVGDFGSDAESIHFRIIARNAAGNEVKSPLEELEFGLKAPGSSSEDEAFHEDPQKMGAVAFGALLFVPLAVHLLDRRKEEGIWDEDDEDEGYDRYSYQGTAEPYELDYDEDVYTQEDYYRSWDQRMP